jgi:hypothetical protein
VPPLEHVAFAELLARVQHDLRPREARFEERQRQHILQLVAIAGRSAKLVGTGPAEQSRSVKLVGQPGVHQPVEVRAIGAHLDLAEPLGPGGAGRRELILRARNADARGGGERLLSARGLAEGDCDLRFAAGRQHDLAQERRDAPSIVAGGAVACASFDHHRGENIPSRSAEESSADCFGRRRLKARRGEGEAPHEIIVGVLKDERRADLLIDNLVDARVRTVVKGEIKEGRDAQAL